MHTEDALFCTLYLCSRQLVSNPANWLFEIVVMWAWEVPRGILHIYGYTLELSIHHFDEWWVCVRLGLLRHWKLEIHIWEKKLCGFRVLSPAHENLGGDSDRSCAIICVSSMIYLNQVKINECEWKRLQMLARSRYSESMTVIHSRDR